MLVLQLLPLGQWLMLKLVDEHTPKDVEAVVGSIGVQLADPYSMSGAAFVMFCIKVHVVSVVTDKLSYLAADRIPLQNVQDLLVLYKVIAPTLSHSHLLP